MVAGAGGRENEEQRLNGSRVLFWGDEMFWKHREVVVTQRCEQASPLFSSYLEVFGCYCSYGIAITPHAYFCGSQFFH